MPCRMDPDPDGESLLTAENRKLTAMLCLAMRSWAPVAKKDPRLHAKVLQQECGVTYVELLSWWHDHVENDAKRKQAEADRAYRKEIKKQALAKVRQALTDEELAVLKVRDDD